MQLFVERAAAVAPFVLTRENARAVVDICQRLDGLPLAIELAAARVKMLAVEQIRDRLHDRFRLLAGGGRTVVARQRTLEAAVDWSYELLADAERRLLARLSVFSGGWTLEAAEQVCSSHGIDASEVLDLLSRLVDKSLVVVDQTAATEPRTDSLKQSANTDASVCSGSARPRRLASGTSTIFSNSPVVPSLN